MIALDDALDCVGWALMVLWVVHDSVWRCYCLCVMAVDGASGCV